MDQVEIVREAIEQIERRLLEKLSVEEIASAAPLSSWHFQRVFRLLVGETVGSYIRKRRLSRSVEALLESDRGILEIALSHGFESQQAYTRAFRAQFGTPPGRFRDRGRRELFASLPAVSAERLCQEQRMRGREPRFVELDPTDYVGIEGRFRSAIADKTDNTAVIPYLWKRFLERRGEVESVVGDGSFGVTDARPSEDAARDDELSYLAGVAVRRSAELPSVPSGMSLRHAPACRYAVFEHCGPLLALPHTIAHVLLTWLPHSGLGYGRGYELERYAWGRAAAGSETEVEYWLPVVDAASPSVGAAT